MTLDDRNKYYGLFFIKQGLLLFWSCWFAIAFLTNMMDFLVAKQIIIASNFHSDNYNALKAVISIYNTPHYILDLLFPLDILAQGISSTLFFIAAFCFWHRNNYWPWINIAFGISMFLWATFLILEEVFIAYSYEGTHIRLFMFEMVSLLMLHLLPHKKINPIVNPRGI